jgi:hypothetical protein
MPQETPGIAESSALSERILVRCLAYSIEALWMRRSPTRLHHSFSGQAGRRLDARVAIVLDLKLAARRMACYRGGCPMMLHGMARLPVNGCLECGREQSI